MPAACIISHMDTDPATCNPNGGFLGDPHKRPSRQMPRVSATPANLTAPRCPRQGSQPGIPPPGRGAPHCPVQEPSVGFLQTTELEGKTGPFLPSCGDPHHPEWGGQSGVPPPGCGVPTSLVGTRCRVPPAHCKGPSLRLRGSPGPQLGAQCRVSLHGGGCSHGPEWEPRVGSLLWVKRVPQ